MRNLLLVAVCFCAADRLTADSNWPQFRGPGSLGTSGEKGLPDTWSRDRNIAWSVEIPGRGWSSPIVWGNRVFLTTAISEGPVEDAKKGLYFGGDRKKPSPHEHRWVVLCLDASTGKMLWDREVKVARPEQPHHVKNTYASETPVSDGERVYAYFGVVGVFAFDMNGKALWSYPVKARGMRFGWGTAASPALGNDALYVVRDNEEESSLLALDKRSGKRLWRVAREEKSNWATPYVWKNELRTEIVTPGAGKVRSYGLDGELLWEFEGMSVITIPTPFSAHGLLYIASGYVLDKIKPAYAIRPGAKGDISLADGSTSNDFIAWSDMSAGPYNTSPLLYGEYFYTLYDRGFLACREAKTGKVIYRKRRLSTDANAFTASPWAYDGKVFCLSEDGDTFVVKPGPEFEVLRVNSLDEMCMATPAIAGGKLYIRTLTRLYCVARAKSAE